jgi:hypothetical protein
MVDLNGIERFPYHYYLGLELMDNIVYSAT